MSERVERKSGPGSRRLISIALFVLAGVLLAASVGGYALRGSAACKANLDSMRTRAVLHTASEGLVDNIAQAARAAKLKELRADKDFRRRGLDEVNAICDEAMNEARAEAEALYSNPVIEDEAALNGAIETLEGVLATSGQLNEKERATYGEIYVALVDGISDWLSVAGEGVSDDAVLENLGKTAPALLSDGNAHLRDGFVRLARDMAQKEQARADAELESQLTSLMTGAIADWSELSGLSGDELWARLTQEVPELSENERFRDALLEAAAARIQAAESGETLPEELKEELLREILAITDGEIKRIFLLRKTIIPTRFTSAMIVQLEPETPPARKNEIMRRIFNILDDSTTWQFSLYDYDVVRGIQVEKIAGSLFYEKGPEQRD